MQERTLTIAEIILIAGTRVALGAGIGLLLSNKFNKDQRNAAGLARMHPRSQNATWGKRGWPCLPC